MRQTTQLYQQSAADKATVMKNRLYAKPNVGFALPRQG